MKVISNIKGLLHVADISVIAVISLAVSLFEFQNMRINSGELP